jgi:hypothetical protein
MRGCSVCVEAGCESWMRTSEEEVAPAYGNEGSRNDLGTARKGSRSTREALPQAESRSSETSFFTFSSSRLRPSCALFSPPASSQTSRVVLFVVKRRSFDATHAKQAAPSVLSRQSSPFRLALFEPALTLTRRRTTALVHLLSLCPTSPSLPSSRCVRHVESASSFSLPCKLMGRLQRITAPLRLLPRYLAATLLYARWWNSTLECAS